MDSFRISKIFDTGINLIVTSQKSDTISHNGSKIKNRSRMWYQMANIEVSKVKGK